MNSLKLRWIVLTILVGAYTTIAYAVDGQVLIDQAKAMAGNVTPGDAPGFPITISRSGSYKLSGNLTVPSPEVGIVITTSNVSIDLNGFTMATSYPQPQLSPSRGIIYEGPGGPTGIRVKNGTIEGFLFPFSLFTNVQGVGFLACRFCSFDDLLARSAFGGTASFDLGSNSRVHNVTAPDLSINVRCPAVVTGTVATSIRQSFYFPFPGYPDADPNSGQCTFANNATLF